MNSEYIDSLDEAAYISSLEQQNREMLNALCGLLADPYLSDPINNDRMEAARQAVMNASKATA